MGARPLRRVIEQYLEDPLAEKLLQQPNLEKSFLAVAKDGAIQFVDQVTLDVTPAAPEPAKAKAER